MLSDTDQGVVTQSCNIILCKVIFRQIDDNVAQKRRSKMIVKYDKNIEIYTKRLCRNCIDLLALSINVTDWRDSCFIIGLLA